MSKYISNSLQDTEKIAEKLASKLKGGEIIAYLGDLGAGKTCFTKGLAAGLGFTGVVTSPTFAIVNEYLGGRLPLYHFDMYRVESWEDLYSSGYFDYEQSGGVLAVEWSENIASVLNEETIYVKIDKLDESSRSIEITGVEGV